MKAFEVKYSCAPTFSDAAVDVVFAKDEEEAKFKFEKRKTLFADYAGDGKNATFKRIPYLDDCENLTLMKKVEKLITEGNWCWPFAGDSLAFYGQLSDKELKAFEKRWLEAYGSEEI